MAKLNLADITDTPGFDVTVNNNNALIEAAIENTLSRDGTQPNQLDTQLDMNSFRINNLADGIDQQDAVTIAQLIQASIAGPVSIGALIDVDLTGIVLDDILQWDGIQFLPVALVLPIQATEITLGIAEIATQAEVDAGVDDLRFVTPAKLNAFPGVNQATETVAGIAEIATQSEANTGSDDSRIITPQKLAGRTATTGRAGVIELATQGEVDTGLDAVRAVTPATLQSKIASASFSGCVITRATDHQSGHTAASPPGGLGGPGETGSQPIPFTSEVFDTGLVDFGTEFHSTSSNITRITIPAGVSKVRLTGNVMWSVFNLIGDQHMNDSGCWYMMIYKNGSRSLTLEPAIVDYQAVYTGRFGCCDVSTLPKDEICDAGQVVTCIINVMPGDFFELHTLTQGSDFGDLVIKAGTSFFELEVIA